MVTVGHLRPTGLHDARPNASGSTSALLARRTLLGSAAALALTARAWSPARPAAPRLVSAASSPLPPRLTRSPQGRILRNGVAWRTAGANEFQLVLNDYPGLRLMSHAEIDSLLDHAVALGCGLVRAHTLGVSVGSAPQHLVSGVTGTGAGTTVRYNAAVWDVMDYAVRAAGVRGLYLMVPLTDELGYFHGGKRSWVNFRRPGSCSTDPRVTAASSATQRAAENNFYTDSQIRTDFKTYVSDWLNHVNVYTGLAYKADPTVAIVETGNEIWTSKDFPSWGPDLARFIKGVAPQVLVADGTACDGQELIAEHIASPYLDIHGCHPYSTFDAATVTAQAGQCEGHGKAYLVGEYPWSKGTAPLVEAAARARPNCFSTAFWSLQNDADRHADGASYGTDDVSLYCPGQDVVQSTAVLRLRAHAAALRGSSSAAPAAPQSYDDTFDGSGAINPAKFAVGLSAGSSVGRVADRLVMTAGTIGGYVDKVTIASRAPAAADRTVRVSLIPADTREAYARVWLRAASSEATGGTLDFGGDAYWIEINAYGNWVLYKRVAGVQATVVGETRIAGFAAGVPVHVEVTLRGASIACRVWTGRTRPLLATRSAFDWSIRSGAYGFVLANGRNSTARTWRAHRWSIS